MYRVTLMALLLVLTQVGAAVAQGAHYWTNPYGTRAQLLGGVVIGSVVDISATYYNPGALSLLTDPGVVAASKTFELNTTSLKTTGSESNIAVSSTKIAEAPGFFGGQFPIFKSVGSFGYSIFTRHRYELQTDDALVLSDEIPPGGTEPIDLTAVFSTEQNLSETWIGLTLSRRLSGRTGLGLTQYVAYRSQSGTAVADARVIWPDTTTAVSTADVRFSYWNARLLWKVGFSFSWNRITFGFTLTTPSVDVLGSGSFWFNRSIFGQDLDGDGTSDPRMAATVQDGLDAAWKSSWALGGGATYAFGPTRLHVAVEGFARVDEFTVIKTEPFETQEPEEEVQTTLTTGYRSVFNFGVGVEHTFSPTTSGFASFRTDLSAIDPEITPVITTTSWDLFFFTVGASARIGTSEFTLGGSIGFGKDQRERLIDLAPEEGGDFLNGLDSTADIFARSYRVIISFAL